MLVDCWWSVGVRECGALGFERGCVLSLGPCWCVGWWEVVIVVEGVRCGFGLEVWVTIEMECL